MSRKGKEVTASADREPPAGGRNEPPVLKVTVNEPLVFQFFLTNTYPHGVIDHVRVRYYVARVNQLGRKPSSFLNWPGPDDNSQPPLQDSVVTEGQFFMDFKPDCRVGTRLKLKISKPGYYTRTCRDSQYAERPRTFFSHRRRRRMSRRRPAPRRDRAPSVPSDRIWRKSVKRPNSGPVIVHKYCKRPVGPGLSLRLAGFHRD